MKICTPRAPLTAKLSLVALQVRQINAQLKTCRATTLDHALLFSGSGGGLTLIPWALRKKKRSKKRKGIMQDCAERFNDEHPELYMRWETRPQKKLLIIRRSELGV